MRTPRVLIASHSQGLGGGAELALLEQVTALTAAGVAVVTTIPGPGPLAQRLSSSGADVRIAMTPAWITWIERSWPLRERLSLVKQITAATIHSLRLLRLERPDVVVTNTITIPALALAARVAGIPHVWMIHEYGSRDHQFLLGFARTVRLIRRLSACVICCSNAVAQHLRETDPNFQAEVIHYGIRSPELPPRPREAGALRAVLLGQLRPEKGQRTAIQAVATVRRKGTNVTLTLVGSSDQREAAELRQLVQQLDIRDAVSFRPFTERPADVWCEADVALMCSRNEAFGRVTVEAMKAGIPVIGSDSGGTREIIEDGVNGLLCRPGDAEAFARALDILARDEPQRLQLAEAAHTTSQRFSPEGYATQLTAAILGVAS